VIKKIAHIGIAVKDLKSAAESYRKLLDCEPSAEEFVADQKVKIIHFKLGESTIELLQGTEPDSPISRFIAKQGEGVHHISYESDDISEETARLKKEGFGLLYEEPKPGSGSSLITFLHPKKTNGVLTEISQHK